jgi:hypothetical protein
VNNPSILKRPDIRAINVALGFCIAGGEVDGSPPGFITDAKAAQEKTSSVPRGGVMLSFSAKELELIWLVLGNGAGDDALKYLRLRPDEEKTFCKAANRIKDAGNLGGPYF